MLVAPANTCHGFLCLFHRMSGMTLVAHKHWECVASWCRQENIGLETRAASLQALPWCVLISLKLLIFSWRNIQYQEGTH